MQQPFRMPQRPTGSLTDAGPPRSPRPTGGLGPGRRPRPTHMWDPERGVIPLDPNAPSRFVPPPPPGVAEAYMQGMARRQGVGREASGGSVSRPIGVSGLQHSQRPLESMRPTGLSYMPGSQGLPIPLGGQKGQQMSDQELRHFWPTTPSMPIPANINRPNVQRY